VTLTTTAVLRPHAEQAYADELAALAAIDDRPRPPGWKLSPWAVTQYILGTTLDDGTEITPKYVGSRRLWRPPSPATPPCSSKAPRAPSKKPSATAGTTRGSSPKAPPSKPSYPARS
jgi:hypothetical protein